MKKLIPALAMLLVAAALMGTSTYAWFSANTEVRASGMSVKAASDGGLAIASYGTNADSSPKTPVEADFASSDVADYKYGNATISPASFTGTNWYTGKAGDTGVHTAVGYQAVTDTAAYAQYTKWQIKSLVENASSKVVVTSVAVTATDGNSAALNNSLRVCIKSADATLFFAPVYTAAPSGTTLKFVSAIGTTDADADGWFDSATLSDATLKYGQSAYTGTVILNDVSTTPEDVDVYLYYEGEDPYCTSANATDIATLNVVITYNVSNS